MSTRLLIHSIVLVLVACPLYAQFNTVGVVTNEPGAFEGYTLLPPNGSKKTYLIDNDGRVINQWTSNHVPGQSAYLLENGDLLRTARPLGQSIFTAGGGGGRVERFSWEGELQWEFDYMSANYRQHHDIEPLPNGNVLVISWDLKTREEAIAAGKNPSKLSNGGMWPDKIIEVQPDGMSGGTIVWEWHAWDHLVQDFDQSKPGYATVSEHPELIDINGQSGPPNEDWLHINSVAYNPELDQIILSVHNFHEIWVIDHSTTSAEAATDSGGRYGYGGDILYRWGNPRMYDRGGVADKKLFGQHDAQWIAAGSPGEGNILVFNNGIRRVGEEYSSVDELKAPQASNGSYIVSTDNAYGPEELVWSYAAPNPQDLFASNISGAQRLPNGNTLICDGPAGELLELTKEKELVWKYVNPDTRIGITEQGKTAIQNEVFKVRRYAPDYPAFTGKDMTPGDFIERYPTGITVPSSSVNDFHLLPGYPNPFIQSLSIPLQLNVNGLITLTVYDVHGREIEVLEHGVVSPGQHGYTWTSTRPAGIYYVVLRSPEGVSMQTLIKGSASMR
jgi:Arylsulfotransferase (ASST)